MNRFIKTHLLRDLEKKMVLLSGPRQAGKTWLAHDIAQHYAKTLYLNYDALKDRMLIKKQSWLPDLDLLIFDEIHKMPDWKNYLKGVYDTKPQTMRILVTGSARLSVYDQVGDSLAGRYFHHHLMPFTPFEQKSSGQPLDIERLLRRGGFPEPYLQEEDREADRWRLQYTSSLLSTDVFEIETIQNLKGMRLLFELLRHRVGSPISYKSLAEDLALSPTTVKKYIEILEAIYVLFRVQPFSKNIARSVLKEPKIYFYDTALIPAENKGQRFENLVALSLLDHCHRKKYIEACPYTLCYLRTKDGEEVDFAVVCNGAVKAAIEVKVADETVSKPLKKFHKKYNFPAFQVVQYIKHEQCLDGITLRKADQFLAEMNL